MKMRVSFFICSLIVSGLAYSQELSIKSDSFHYDNKTGIATYTGNVFAKQGEKQLTGNRLEIYRNEKTGKMDKIIVYGKPAKYQGAVEEGKPPVFAKANKITYDLPNEFLTLSGNAQVQQNEDIYRAEQIEYDGIKDTVYSPPSSRGQTTIILKDLENAGI
ncbi:MAG: lipopolysaccharide transport periplasmic protein LptA [Gammaproteobacteria bacterium]|jgi:lipopolysaccharide export system protein LptA